ncbi:spermidine/putrescine ABC transporter permease, partial [Rathayibacter sp. AY1D7]
QDGLFFQGCTAGAFPAVAQFTVTSAAPEALRERFPIGTSLRFALEGDEIRVRSDAP